MGAPLRSLLFFDRIFKINSALCSGHVSESISSFDFVDDQFFADLERTERVEAQFVFDKMRELLERTDDDGQGMRRAADLGRMSAI